MKATLHSYRQSPRKVRLVADVIRGKQVPQALAALRFLTKRAADPVRKLLESAVANAKTGHALTNEKLVVKSVTVDKGRTLKRSMPRARGHASPIHKRTSHITLVLEEQE